MRIKLQSTKGLNSELGEQHQKLEEIVKSIRDEKHQKEDELVRYTTLISDHEHNYGGSKINPGQQRRIAITENNLDKPDENYLYLGDDVKDKSRFELNALGLANAEDDKGPGWYKLRLLDREEVEMKAENMNNHQLHKEIEKLILENGELASHLEKSNDMLNIYREMESDKRQSEQLDLQILDAKVKEEVEQISDLKRLLNQRMEGGNDMQNMQDIEYDENDDMFSVSELSPDDTFNYFDLVVNYVELDRYQLQELYKRKMIDVTNAVPKTIITVEFYNFDTVVSQMYQEIQFDPNFQASFAVTVDKKMLNFCMHQSVQIELFSLVGTDKIKLGESHFSLAELMQRNAACLMKSRNLCAIIRKRQEVSNPLLGRTIGQMSVSYRMRKPCGVAAKLYIEEVAGENLVSEQTGMKKIIVKIPFVRGLTQTVPTFVSYSMPDGVTYYTNTVMAVNPIYNFSNTHDLLFTDELKNRLATEPIELAVFDEAKPPNNQDNTDIIGFGTISLAPLLLGKPLNELVHLRNPATGTSCHVQIEVFVYGGYQDQEYYDQLQASGMLSATDQVVNEEYKKMMMTSMRFGQDGTLGKDRRTLAKDFADYLHTKTVNLDSAFMIMDKSNRI